MHLSAFCALSILILHLCQAQRYYIETLTVGNGAPWGNWQNIQFCPTGYFAKGYNMKIEGKIGRRDDTSMNGIRLLCGPRSGGIGFGGHITSGTSPWGYWRGSDKTCSSGSFLVGFTLQVERQRGRRVDDTAANYIRFECRNKDDYTDYYVLNHSMGSGYWGSFGAWSNKCPSGSAICGIKTKLERPQGRGDDTALNDVRFYCCRF